jgi:bifunctional DNA-binding transcriptional regulator/antitoxin component of YhaV-PrlF toxin-antitoxin module
MKKTEYTRKLDSHGRLVIPSKLREDCGIHPGDMYTFYTFERNGKFFLCVECPNKETDLAKAMKILEKNGLKAVDKNVNV